LIQLSAQLIRYEPGEEMAAHADGCRRLSVLIGGAQAEHGAGRVESARVGSVALKGAEFEHRNRFGVDGCTILSVVLPERTLAALSRPAERLLDWRWVHSGAPTLHALGMAACLRGGDGAGAAQRLMALLGAFTHGADERCATQSARLDSRPDPRAERVARTLIAATPERAPSVGELAAAEGLHPASLDRVFRRRHGCSVTTFRQRQRVRAVAEQLLDDDTPLVHVALQHGFSDMSHMSRVFAREIGVSPGRFRALLRAQPRGLDSFKTAWQLTA